MEMENRTFQGLFHFSRTQFFPNFCIKQPVASKLKGALDFFDLCCSPGFYHQCDTGDKDRDYRIN